MASFVITHTNGTVYTNIGEGTVDNSLGLSLIGQNYHNYGQLIGNNFLRLLENQASDTPPKNPQAGQLWWNTATSVLSFFDGSKFKPCSSSAVSNTPPLKPLDGDQWWDVDSSQLKIYDGEEWIVVGPLYTKGQLFSGILPESVTDVNGVSHDITTMKVTGGTVAVVSKDDPFILATPINGTASITTGITLTGNSTLAGTTSNSAMLGGIPASKFVNTDSPTTTLLGSVIVQGIGGVVIGTQHPLTISNSQNSNTVSSILGNVIISGGIAAISLNAADGTITVSREPTVGNSIVTKGYTDTLVTGTSTQDRNYTDLQIANIVASSPLSTLNSLSTAVDNDIHFATNVYASIDLKANNNSPEFTGTPRAPTTTRTDSSSKLATTAFVQDLVTSTISSGSLSSTIVYSSLIPSSDNLYDLGSTDKRFRLLYGTAIRSQYADLAEMYISDAPYTAGTVVVFGGKEEITVSDRYCDTRIAGVISTNPAYLMNDNKKGSMVALTGKVPVKVLGAVKKGDVIVNSQFAGVASPLELQSEWKPGCVIGKSLEDNDQFGIRDVMVSVGRF